MLKDYVNNEHPILRGEVYFCELPQASGSVQGGVRPVVIVSNNIGNKFSQIVTVVPMTSQNKKNLPTHVDVERDGGLVKPSTALCEQTLTVNQNSLLDFVGTLSLETMRKIAEGMKVSLCL